MSPRIQIQETMTDERAATLGLIPCARKAQTWHLPFKRWPRCDCGPCCVARERAANGLPSSQREARRRLVEESWEKKAEALERVIKELSLRRG